MHKKGREEKLNTKMANEVMDLGSIVLKILAVLLVILILLVGTNLLKSWHILAVIGTILVVISPVFIGLVIAWIFDPFVTWMEKHKIRRGLGTLVTYLLLFGGLFLIFALIIPTFSEQLNDFVASIPNILKSIKGFIGDIFDYLSDLFTYNLQSTEEAVLKKIETFGLEIATGLPDTIIGVAKNLISAGTSIVLGLMFGFYLLLDFPRLGRYISNIIPKKWHRDADHLTERLNHSLRSYVNGTLLIMLLVFLAQSFGFLISGLKAPLLFGLFCAITNIIPYLGPYIGGAPAVIVGFSQSPVTGICALISVVIVQLVESNILQPVVMGKTMKLHPVTIMIGLLVFQHFFGMLGLILATPLIATGKILGEFCYKKWKQYKKEQEAQETEKSATT